MFHYVPLTVVVMSSTFPCLLWKKMLIYREIPKVTYSKPKERFTIVTAVSLGVVLTHHRRDFEDLGLDVISLNILNPWRLQLRAVKPCSLSRESRWLLKVLTPLTQFLCAHTSAVLIRLLWLLMSISQYCLYCLFLVISVSKNGKGKRLRCC